MSFCNLFMERNDLRTNTISILNCPVFHTFATFLWSPALRRPLCFHVAAAERGNMSSPRPPRCLSRCLSRGGSRAGLRPCTMAIVQHAVRAGESIPLKNEYSTGRASLLGSNNDICSVFLPKLVWGTVGVTAVFAPDHRHIFATDEGTSHLMCRLNVTSTS